MANKISPYAILVLAWFMLTTLQAQVEQQPDTLRFDPLTGEPVEEETEPDTTLQFDPETGLPAKAEPEAPAPPQFDPETGLPPTETPDTSAILRFDPTTGLPIETQPVAPAPPAVFVAKPLQQYPKGKVYLKSGIFIEGKALRIGSETATITVGGRRMNYNLADVRLIMAKKGLGKKVGAGCGGGCVGMVLASSSEMELGPLLVGGTFWVAVSYGCGYLIGMLLDQWQVVYIGTS